MIHVIEQNTITVAVNNQTRSNKREISSVDRKGVTNRSKMIPATRMDENDYVKKLVCTIITDTMGKDW